MINKTVLNIKNLFFSYEKELVLEDINLNIEQKDFMAIIGPNGGGKSTLVKLMLSLLNSKKSIKINGILGYVPQNTNVNINFPITVLEVIMMGKNKSDKLFAKELLEKVGMSDFGNHKIGSLSGGQRQRVMIARALYSKPTILILDEPTSSIDIQGQKQIYELLKELNNNITIIVVSHDLSVILKYATKVAHINKVISFHNMDSIKKEFKTNDDDHFCEVELLEMLNQEKKHKKSCGC